MSVPRCDHYERPISYLRISVTDRCNLRCVYCMPEEGIQLGSHDAMLRYEEIARLARLATDIGITKVRLTGGEPLVRAGIVDLVRMLSAIRRIQDLSMTTNGALLARYAPALAKAGLHRVNVSLDTLDGLKFGQLTRGGELSATLDGIRAAEEAGLAPVKINVVVARGMNDDELAAFAMETLAHAWHVRFIEIMPLGEGALWADDGYMPSGEMRRIIQEALGPLDPAQVEGNGPARYWRIPGAQGTIGFISPVSEHFCAHCNRLRLTADGRLLPCLLSGTEIDVRSSLRQGADDDALRGLFLAAISAKPDGHHLAEHRVPEARLMSQTGG